MIAEGKRVLVITASTHIARSIDVVRRHFSDVEHHAKNPVHPDVTFTPLANPRGERRFRKTIRIVGIPVVDEVVLRCLADGSIAEDSVAGLNRGMRLISRFRAEGPDVTDTTLMVEMPVQGLKRLAAPLLRRLVLRRLTKALEEDRRDLESGRYP